MRIYQCDSCNKVILNPHTVKMKEFYVKIDTDCLTGVAIPSDECYKGLNLLGELVPKKRESEKQ